MAEKEKEVTTEVDATLAEETKSGLNWKEAAAKLKGHIDTIDSIDNYFIKDDILALRERFNSKERTKELFDLIMQLNGGV